MKQPTKLRILVLLAVLALLAAACGGDGGDGGDAGEVAGDEAQTLTTQPATGSPIVVGLMCDETGPTSLVGLNLCPGFTDYVDLVNNTGGVDNHPLEVIKIDNAYEVPRGVDAYRQMVDRGAVVVACYGTPIALALVEQSAQSQVPCLTPGFGVASATDGERFPYQFPLAASYVSQGAAAVDHVLSEADKEPSELKVAYLYYDNAAGQEPLELLRQVSEEEGFELQTFAVPPPGLEMTAQVTDIVNRFRADWVIAHLFGRAPSVSITTLKRAGFPLDRVVSFVWGGAEADIEAAGGMDFAEGYRTLQFAGVGTDLPLVERIRALYQARGQQPPDAMENTVYYNRGVYIAGIITEGIRLALEQGGEPLNGQKVKQGLESFENTSIGEGELAPPLTTGPRDHEGGGFTRVYQVQDGALTPITDWVNPRRDAVLEVLGLPTS